MTDNIDTTLTQPVASGNPTRWQWAKRTWQWLAGVDKALILAALVEVPRWAAAFAAVHEPLIVGVPLGILLAYATSESWKAYFADRRRFGLLTLNVIGLASAVIVITPVLYAMTSVPLDEVELAAVLPDDMRMAWAGVLAATTFLPLIQLAAAKYSGRTDVVQTPATQPETVTGHSAAIAGRSGAIEADNVRTHDSDARTLTGPENWLERSNRELAELVGRSHEWVRRNRDNGKLADAVTTALATQPATTGTD